MTKNKQTILYLFLILTIEIFAQNTYYEDKVSQFNILKNEKHKNYNTPRKTNNFQKSLI